MNDGHQLAASDEVDPRQLELAQAAGGAYRDALEYMIEEVAHTGATVVRGDFLVGIAQEAAEGLYRPTARGSLEWSEPTDENCHLEVAVADAADGRFVPNLAVEATFVDGDGGEHGPHEIPYVWHPGLHHYGRNVELPGAGRYDIRVAVEPPSFHRHDRENGDRYADGVEVVFEDVDVTTGRD